MCIPDAYGKVEFGVRDEGFVLTKETHDILKKDILCVVRKEDILGISTEVGVYRPTNTYEEVQVRVVVTVVPHIIIPSSGMVVRFYNGMAYIVYTCSSVYTPDPVFTLYVTSV